MSLLQKTDLWGEDIPFLCGLREKGAATFAKKGLPNAKTEAWKYSYFKEDDLQNPQIDVEPLNCDVHCHETKDLPFEAIQVKYCNGKIHSEGYAQEGLTIKPLPEAIYDGDVKKYLNKTFEADDFPFAALNTAYLEQGLFILVESGTVLTKPLYIHYHNHNDKNRLCNIRNVIVLENRAKATVIEHFDGEENAVYTQNIVNEIFVGNSATLQHYTWQNEAQNAHHIDLNSVQIKADGSYRSFYANGVCKYARHESYVRLIQQGASANLNAAYRLSQKNQVCDITANIRHLAPHTYSDQLIKGVAQAAAKGVFQGQIHIAHDAQQCEGHQLHRALLIDENAEIDSKPELEIFADDVKCSHGSSTGDLDNEQIFYLQSRGISEDEAREILTKAYLSEVFALNPDKIISDWIQEQF